MKQLNLARLERMWNAYLKAIYWLWVHGSLLLVYGIGVYYTLSLLTNMEADTTHVTNAGFVIVASLAGLCFSCARSVQDAPDVRERLVYAGERFFHAGLLLLLASVLKYTMLNMMKSELLANHAFLKSVVALPIGTIASGLFFWAVNTAHTALRVINQLLWARITRQRDWDDLV